MGFIKNKSDNLMRFRGQRRTSRMIEHAIQACPGKRALLFFCDRRVAEHAMQMTMGQKKDIVKVCINDRSIEMANGAVLAFKAVNDRRFSWEAERYEGYPVSTPIYVDHSAWEAKFQKAIEGYHNWD